MSRLVHPGREPRLFCPTCLMQRHDSITSAAEMHATGLDVGAHQGWWRTSASAVMASSVSLKTRQCLVGSATDV